MNWDEIYKKLGIFQKQPRESVKNLIPLLKKENVKIVMDLGCGTGRHTILLAEQGFFVIASDSEREALKITKKIINESKLNNIIILEHNLSKIPLIDEYIDAIVCYDVIQHGTLSDAKKYVEEMKRVLKKNGILFIGVVSTKYFSFGTGDEIEPGTFLNMPGKLDGDIPHHFYTEEEIKKLFSDFEILDIKESICSSELNPDKQSGEWLLTLRKM